jgi:hypothetical protein
MRAKQGCATWPTQVQLSDRWPGRQAQRQPFALLDGSQPPGQRKLSQGKRKRLARTTLTEQG